MTDHWALKYIGGEFTKEKDCYWWFRKITREQFGLDVPAVNVSCSRSLRGVVKLMGADVDDMFGYTRTDTPREGDAVFLTGNGRSSHHIGLVIFIGRRMLILHAVEGAGVVAVDPAGLRTSGMTVKGFWTNENITQYEPA